MSPISLHRRGRALAAFGAAAGLLVAGSAGAIATAPAGTAAPAGAAAVCDTAYPVAELAPDQAVTGLTVSKGTDPDGFTGKVLGVLDDGIAPDVDMIMVRLTSSEIDRVGGIWQGMSGSPVYATDGRLIGAVSYGLSYGPSPVAGVTPYASMDDYVAAAAPGKVAVGAKVARAIAASSDVTAAEAKEGFSQLRMPIGVSGVSSRTLAHLKNRPYLTKNTYRMGKAAAAGDGPGADTIVAGGNLAASLSYGDITMGGVGTATSVCNGRVVGFGHPLGFFGKTTLSLHPADAIYVQEDPAGAPYKLANLGAPAGTIDNDRLTGIAGVIGALPTYTDITSKVTYGARTRTGSSHVSLSDGNAEVAYYQQVANHERVLDGYAKGSEVNTWTITGTDEKGKAFSLKATDRFVSPYDVSDEPSYALADFLYGLSSLPKVKVTSVSADAKVVDDFSTWTVSAIEQRRGGTWVKVTRKAPATAKAGGTLSVRAVMKSAGATKYVPVSYKVPKKAVKTRAVVQFIGGNSTSRDSFFESVAGARSVLKKAVRNDGIVAEFATPGDISQYGYDEEEYYKGAARKPAKEVHFDQVKVLGPATKVVEGNIQMRVNIK